MHKVILVVINIILGNKSDLEHLREVEFAEAEAMCEFIPEVLCVLEASAKENTNIEDAFICLATELKVSDFNINSKNLYV